MSASADPSHRGAGVLVPVDEDTARDWHTFTSRALKTDPEAAIRLQVTGTTLVLTVAPLYPRSLGEAMPLVLGMRMLQLSTPSAEANAGVDVVVPCAALLDRFARNQTAVPVPPQQVLVPWAGLAPPRSGWAQTGMVDASVLQAHAKDGIATIAQGTPAGAGSHAVTALRARVWGGTDALGDVPLGAAYAALSLGFLHPGWAKIYRDGPWWRLSTPAGHVLGR